MSQVSTNYRHGFRDTKGTKPHTPAATTPNSGAIIDFLNNKLLPQVDGAIGNISAVTNQSISINISSAAVDRSSPAVITVDYADVLMLKALLFALKSNLELLRVYGLNVHIPSVVGSEAKQLLNYKQLFQNDSTLLVAQNPDRLQVARTALVNFIDTYTLSTNFIFTRSVPDNHLFVIDIPLSDAPVSESSSELAKVKKALAEIKASLSGPKLYTFIDAGSDRDRYVNLSFLFNSTHPINFRSLIADCSNQTVLTDTTLGGLFPMGFEFLEKYAMRYQKDVLGVMCEGHEKPFALISPSSASFYDYFFDGYKSPPQSISVQNIGTAPLQVSSVAMTGRDKSEFQIMDNNCPATLDPKSSCALNLNFLPATIGAKDAELLVQTNDATAPLSYAQLNGYFDGKPLLGNSSNKLVVVGDPNTAGTIYAAIYGAGVFKSTNMGQTWTSLSSGLPNKYVLCFAVDPTNPLVMYTGTYGGGVFSSKNGGSSWSAVNNGISFPYITSLAVSNTSPQTIYAGTNGGLFKSTNGGTTWFSVGSERGWGEILKVLIDPHDANKVYVLGAYVLCKTVDGGLTWATITSGLPEDSWFVDIAVDPSLSNTLYLATYYGLYKSTDGGSTWLESYSGYGINGITIKTAQPATLYINTSNGIFATTNGGSTWSQVALYGRNSSIFADLFDADRLYSSGAAGAVAVSTDNGASWSEITITALTSSWSIQVFSPASSNPQIIYAGSDGGGIQKSTNGGASWVFFNNGLTDKHVVDIDVHPTNPDIVYAVTGSGIFKSSNGGMGWSASTNPAGQVTGIVISRSSPTTLFASTYSGVYKSTDSGISWTLSDLTQKANVLAISYNSSNIIYAGTNYGVYKSSNDGDTWESMNNGLTNSYINSIAVDPANSSIVYAGTSSGIYKSDDGGSNWSLSSNNMMRWGWTPGVHSIVINPNTPTNVYVGTDYGVYRSCDSGALWTHMDAGGTSNTTSISLPSATTQYLLALGYNGIFKVSLAQNQVNFYQFIYNRAGTGTGTVYLSTGGEYSNPFSQNVPDGTTLVLTAQAGIGSVFAGWSGCDSLTSDNECKVTVHSTKNVNATFSLDTRPISVVASPASGAYASPLSVSLIANRNAAIYYTVDNSTPTTSSRQYTAPFQFMGNTTLKFMSVAGNQTSVFKTEYYTVTIPMYILAVTFTGGGYGSVHSSPAGISMTSGTDSGKFAGGSKVNLYEATGATSQFAGWSGACTGSANCTVIMDDNKLVIADFRLMPLIRISSVPTVYYPSLQEAFAAAHSGDTIEARSFDYSGNLLLDSGLILTFRGGLDYSFLNHNGTSSLHGTLAIGSGSFTVDRLTIR